MPILTNPHIPQIPLSKKRGSIRLVHDAAPYSQVRQIQDDAFDDEPLKWNGKIHEFRPHWQTGLGLILGIFLLVLLVWGVGPLIWNVGHVIVDAMVNFRF